MINIRFLSRQWAVTVAEAEGEGKIVVSAFSDRFGVGVQEDVPLEQWTDTADEHKDDLVLSLAMLSLLHHASQLRVLVGDREPVLETKDHIAA